MRCRERKDETCRVSSARGQRCAVWGPVAAVGAHPDLAPLPLHWPLVAPRTSLGARAREPRVIRTMRRGTSRWHGQMYATDNTQVSANISMSLNPYTFATSHQITLPWCMKCIRHNNDVHSRSTDLKIPEVEPVCCCENCLGRALCM